MRHVHEVLRLKWEQGFSDRKIAHSLGISRPAMTMPSGPPMPFVRRPKSFVAGE
jgi:hypothetical protein